MNTFYSYLFANINLVVFFSSTLTSLLVGLIYGYLAGYRRGYNKDKTVYKTIEMNSPYQEGYDWGYCGGSSIENPYEYKVYGKGLEWERGRMAGKVDKFNDSKPQKN